MYSHVHTLTHTAEYNPSTVGVMRVWVHFMQDTVKERLSPRWHDRVNPMWWHPPSSLWGWVSLQCLHLCLCEKSPAVQFVASHGKCFLTQDITHTWTGGAFFFKKQTLWGFVGAYFIIRETCLLCISFGFKPSFSFWRTAWQPTQHLIEHFVHA